MKPHVFVLIADCLRAANATSRTLPSVAAAETVTFDRCYTAGTWTLPAHASLYTGQTPLNHGVTRRGDKLKQAQATLPQTAREANYRTALFSENPTFSRKTGFGHGIDYVDDSIHRKLFRSTFSADAHVDGVNPEAVPTLLREIVRRPNRFVNLANTVYGLATEVSPPDKTAYPHHGEQVMTHLRRFVAAEQNKALFCLVNLLDTHNPHHAPPEAGAKALGLSVPSAERQALAAVNDDKLFMLDNADLPPETQDWFDSWEAVFARREEIYNAQIRYFDRLIDDWLETVPDRMLDESLVVITGDHGQLFGAEGQLGHQTSLHPHGIHVPLSILPPTSWETNVDVSVPVTWVGLSAALKGVIEGSVTGTGEFVDTVVKSSRTDGHVVVCADGPTWNVATLRESYDPDAVEALAIRRIGIIDSEAMTVYESPWNDSTIKRTVYDLVNGTRERRDEIVDATPPERYAEWLRGSGERKLATETSDRLRQLGYV